MIFRRKPTIRALSAAALILAATACGEPASKVAPLDQAKAALQSGDGLAAEAILRNMLAAGDQTADLAAYLGEAELQQGGLAEARKWLEPKTFSAESKGHGFHMLGRLEMESDNLPAAGKAFDQALAENGEDAELWVDIGRLRYLGGEQAQAVEASIHAVEIDPRNADALRFRAQLVRDSQGALSALSWFEKALEIRPEDVGLLGDYAATLGELGRAREMLQIIRRIAKIDPANRHIFYLQAVLAARAGKFHLAQSLLLRSDRVDREKPAGLLLSGIIDLENGNYASAAQTLERLAAMQPDNRRVSQLFAKALAMDGKDRELIYRFSDAAGRPGASPYLQSLVGRSMETIDERENAAKFLDLAARTRSGNLVALQGSTALGVAEARGPTSGFDALALVRAWIAAGNPQSAVAAADSFLARFPGSSDALTMSGDAYLVVGNYAAAAAKYEKASAIRSPWIAARKRVKALEAVGRDADATALLKAHLAGDPSNAEVAILLARKAAKVNDWNGAAVYADHALANGGASDPLLLALRAEIAINLNDIEYAVDLAEEAYALQPMNVQTTRTLAAAYRNIEGGDILAEALEKKVKQLAN